MYMYMYTIYIYTYIFVYVYYISIHIYKYVYMYTYILIKIIRRKMCFITDCTCSSKYHYSNRLYCAKHFRAIPDPSKSFSDSMLFQRTVDVCDMCTARAIYIKDFVYLCKRHYKNQ